LGADGAHGCCGGQGAALLSGPRAEAAGERRREAKHVSTLPVFLL